MRGRGATTRRALALLGVLGFLGWSFRGLPPLMGMIASLPTEFVDEVTLYDQRFAETRARLPAGQIAGYRSETLRIGGQELFVYTLDDKNYAMHPTRAFFLTQYALAPTIVVRSETRPVVVENLRERVRLAPGQDARGQSAPRQETPGQNTPGQGAMGR